MSLDLGGPGPGCSAMRVRRLLLDELSGAEKERVQAHVEGCERCSAMKREIEQEKAALLRDVPFPAFAAGMAEKLAETPRRSFVARFGPLAAAAALLLAAGVLVLRPADTETVRSKGSPTVQLFVHDEGGVHELSPAEPLAEGADLMLALHPAGRTQAAAVLLEPGEASVVYSGIAINGTVPNAFGWTGKGEATLLVVFADRKIDAAGIRGVSDVPPDAVAVQVKLRR